MSKEFPLRVVATMVSGKMMLAEGVDFYKGCAEIFDYLSQGKQTNLAFSNRGALWCLSVLAEQYPQFVGIDCGKGRAAVEFCLVRLCAQYGELLPVQPADRPFLSLPPEEEWANTKGITQEEAKQQVIRVQIEGEADVAP